MDWIMTFWFDIKIFVSSFCFKKSKLHVWNVKIIHSESQNTIQENEILRTKNQDFQLTFLEFQIQIWSFQFDDIKFSLWISCYVMFSR